MAKPWREPFLEAIRHIPVIAHGCRVAGISQDQVYKTRKNDPEFARAFEEAMEYGVDRAESEAFRRAVDGWEEPVIAQGRLVRGDKDQPLMQRKYSDTLLTVVLKARRKAYGTQRTELTDGNGDPIKSTPTVIVTGVLRDPEPEPFVDDGGPLA